jgi:hypothetical protein
MSAVYSNVQVRLGLDPVAADRLLGLLTWAYDNVPEQAEEDDMSMIADVSEQIDQQLTEMGYYGSL